MAIVIDSSGWLEYFLEGPLASRYAASVRETDVLMPTIVLYEVYKALKQRLEKAAVARALAQMSERPTISLDETLALAAAETSLAHDLPMADAIIYATAQVHEAKLVTSDAHFKGLPGVVYVAQEPGVA